MGKSRELSDKLWSIVDKGLTGWSILLMGTMATMVVLTVIFRYVFNLTYVWSEEAIVYLFIATTYFGSVICVEEKEHIDIPFLRDSAPKTVRFVMDILVCLVNICVQIGLAFFSFTWVEKTGSSITSGINLPFYSVYLIFPVCFILMGIYTIRRMERNIVPAYQDSTASPVVKKIVDVVICLIYAGLLGGVVYIYKSINWFAKFQTSMHLFMLKVITTVYHVMFLISILILAIYVVKRLIGVFKRGSIPTSGGEQ